MASQLRLKDLPHRDWLQSMYVLQKDLQQQINGGKAIDEFTIPEHIDELKDNAFALMAEMFEAFGEIGWKSWATSRHLRHEAFQAEMVDMFKFFLNMMLHAGMTPKDLLSGFMRKHSINIERLVNGYDGVSTKCSICGREYSDKGVECSPGVHVMQPPQQMELKIDVEPARVSRRSNDARRAVRQHDAGVGKKGLRLDRGSRGRDKQSNDRRRVV